MRPLWCQLRDSSYFVTADKNPRPVACECFTSNFHLPKIKAHVILLLSKFIQKIPSLPQYITLGILTPNLPWSPAADQGVRTQICADSVTLGCKVY